MTELNKPVSRRARHASFHYRGKSRRIVVTLEPGDMIAMRVEGTRSTVRAGLKAVFNQMTEWWGQAEMRRKVMERKQRKGII